MCYIVCMKIEQGHVYKEHNKSALLYHLVCPVRYRRKAITEDVEKTIVSTCAEISQRYEIHFTEIGTDIDHVHFLIQSVPVLSPKQIAQTVKSIIAREVFTHHPDVKKMLWGGKFWTSGYYINTVGLYGGKDMIQQYVKHQGNNTYKQIHIDTLQLSLFT